MRVVLDRDARSAAVADRSAVIDRRTEPRADLQLRVEYTRLNRFFADYTRNLSRGGTFIASEDPFPVGTEFIFRLVVPRLPDPIVLRGQVMWIIHRGASRCAIQCAGDPPCPPDIDSAQRSGAPFIDDVNGPGPGMGIRFLYDSPEQRAAITETVEDLMIESLGRNLYSKLMGKAK